MAISVTIVGQGTVQRATASVARSYALGDLVHTVITESGAAYTLTAAPANGWSFDHYVVELDFIYEISDDYGSTWTTWSQDHARWPNYRPDTNPWPCPLIGKTWVELSRPFEIPLFEGSCLDVHDSSFGDSGMIHERLQVSNPQVTAVFTRNPVGPGPILRSDAGVILRSDAGVILRQG